MEIVDTTKASAALGRFVDVFGKTCEGDYAALVQLANDFPPLPDHIIFIEGNIAAGKSTLIRAKEGVIEPVVEWSNITYEGSPIFEAYYRNKDRDGRIVWAFQMLVLFSRCHSIHDAIESGRAIRSTWFAERSPFSDELFFDINRGNCTTECADVYKKCARILKSKFLNCHFYFMPRLPASELVERIRKRARAGEDASTISKAYLEALESAHADLARQLEARRQHSI